MIQPRNNLVVIRPINKAEQRVGKIIVPDMSDNYVEAEVIAVGPGVQVIGNQRADTFDLHPGQRVLVKLFSHRQTSVGMTKVPDGIKLIENDGVYYAVAEPSIVGIIAEPVPAA